MTSAIEETVKALVEFESELEKAKGEGLEARRKTAKDAVDWAESARAAVVSKAQQVAEQRVGKAKQEAEAQADKIRKKGEADMKSFEDSISKHKSKAADLIASRLLGESK